MKTLAPALLLALSACAGLSTSSDQDRPIAAAVSGQQTSAQQSKKLSELNLGVDGNVTDTPGSKTPEIDPTRRFEYAEVTVELGDPNGMRALVPFLMKPETWTLIKCEMVSTTSKFYKFQKVTSNDGRSLPDVDIFKSRR